MAATERLSLLIEGRTTGEQEVNKLADAINRVTTASDNLSQKKPKAPDPSEFEKFAAGVKQFIHDPLDGIGNAVEGALNAMGPLGSGVAAAGGGIAILYERANAAVESLAKLGTETANVALRTGLTTKEVGQFSYAAKLANQDVSIFETMMRKLSQGLSDTSEDGAKARAALGELGVKGRDAHGALRPMADIFLDISRNLSGMEDVANRNTLAVQLFGRAGIEALPAILGLADGVKRAKELGLGLSEEDVARFEEYHKKLVEIDSAWDRAVRKFKDNPLIATIIFSTKGIPTWLLNQFNEASAQHSDRMTAKEQADLNYAYHAVPFYGPPGGENHSENYIDVAGILKGKMPGADYAAQYQASVASDIASVQRGGSLIDRVRQQIGLTKEGIEDAYRAAADDAKKARAEFLALDKTSTPEDVVQKKQKSMDDATAEASKWKSRLDGIKKTEEAERERQTFLKQLSAEEERAYEASLNSADRVLAKRDAEIRKAEKLKFTEEQLAQVRERENAIAGIELATQSKKAWEEFEQYDQKRVTDRQNEQRKSGMSIMLAGGPSAEQLKAWSAGYKADEEIAGLRNSAAISDTRVESSRVTRLAELYAGPGNQKAAIDAGYAQRLQLAEQLYQVELDAIAKMTDGNEAAVAFTKADIVLKREERDAEIEHELKLAELQRQRVDNLRNEAGQLLDALEHGGAGIEQFLKNTANGWLRTMFQNAAVELFGGSSGHLTIPGQTTNGKQNTLGKILNGTPFGVDPLKDATHANTLVTVDNTRAIALLSAKLAMSASGGGGGMYSSTASTFARLMSSGAGGDSGGSGEGDGPEGHALPTDLFGVNGDYGGEYSDPVDPSTIMAGAGASKSGWGKGVGYAAAIAGGAFGIYNGVQQGGARGAIAATGAASGMAGGILALAGVTGPAAPILMGLGLGLSLLPSLLPNRRVERENYESDLLNNSKFTLPDPTDYSLDMRGNQIDRGAGGRITVVNNHYWNVDTMDAKSFMDNQASIGEAVRQQLGTNFALINAVQSAAA